MNLGGNKHFATKLQRNRYVISSTWNKRQFIERNNCTYNQYYKNKTNDLVGQQQSEVMDFYIPIGAILVELQDCPNNLTGIGSNNVHLLAAPKSITLKLSGTIYSTNMYSALFGKVVKL